MTDTIEAVALKLRADLDEASKQHMPAMVVTTDYLRTVLDSIAAQKAEIKRLTEREAQAKMDGVKAGIEAAKAALKDETRSGPDDTWSDGWEDCWCAIRALDVEAISHANVHRLTTSERKAMERATLEVHAAFEGRRAAALSDIIAGDADLIVPDTLADSDGDDGA